MNEGLHGCPHTPWLNVTIGTMLAITTVDVVMITATTVVTIIPAMTYHGLTVSGLTAAVLLAFNAGRPRHRCASEAEGSFFFFFFFCGGGGRGVGGLEGLEGGGLS